VLGGKPLEDVVLLNEVLGVSLSHSLEEVSPISGGLEDRSPIVASCRVSSVVWGRYSSLSNLSLVVAGGVSMRSVVGVLVFFPKVVPAVVKVTSCILDCSDVTVLAEEVEVGHVLLTTGGEDDDCVEVYSVILVKFLDDLDPSRL